LKGSSRTAAARHWGGAYDRTQYLADRIVLMQKWADYLDALRTGGNVVQLRAA